MRLQRFLGFLATKLQPTFLSPTLNLQAGSFLQIGFGKQPIAATTWLISQFLNCRFLNLFETQFLYFFWVVWQGQVLARRKHASRAGGGVGLFVGAKVGTEIGDEVGTDVGDAVLGEEDADVDVDATGEALADASSEIDGAEVDASVGTKVGTGLGATVGALFCG